MGSRDAGVRARREGAKTLQFSREDSRTTDAGIMIILQFLSILKINVSETVKVHRISQAENEAKKTIENGVIAGMSAPSQQVTEVFHHM